MPDTTVAPPESFQPCAPSKSPPGTGEYGIGSSQRTNAGDAVCPSQLRRPALAGDAATPVAMAQPTASAASTRTRKPFFTATPSRLDRKSAQ